MNSNIKSKLLDKLIKNGMDTVFAEMVISSIQKAMKELDLEFRYIKN